MAKEMEAWGRDKATERYGSKGMTPVSEKARAVERKKGGSVPGSDSPPLVPSEWPPHPLKNRGGKV